MTTVETGTEELPIRIPLARCWDVQWNPPGVPSLVCYSLRNPYFDNTPIERGGHYTFERRASGGLFFVRVLASGERLPIFDAVDWVAVNDQVLMFNGNHWFGTVIKGLALPENRHRGCYEGTSKPTEDEAQTWLETNFSVDSVIVTLKVVTDNDGSTVLACTNLVGVEVARLIDSLSYHQILAHLREAMGSHQYQRITLLDEGGNVIEETDGELKFEASAKASIG
eukprot:TRINITY_DN43885_c0_g1_i1.p1 TRINITY_DN43885_c0_g1~~TRINITY_DN43885_c0_g1_i1.p1  ORF type:complete len:225 (-),score=23.95 TRINITY_DN43885_c0_g1_i1:77-751(-)